ncbi:histidine phosphatase family protein [Streptomyces chumphonensis]|uniref:Histidine phosphatase family protein n=1 Tax=Streptomyces chumphonensis TaxID=1214925 RepID=A0A927ICG6_9ACTN|nr:histidine phosphatase family protein [Streptomyces chumphonensis]MBD3931604.1 histidine phosphatase family protein [Streptomyces chumphonensis]
MRARLTLLAAARSAPLLDARFDDDRPLDDAGWRELHRRVSALAPLAAAELRYCSPSTGCRETGRALGLAPLAQPALRDCDMGRWHGLTLREVTAHEPRAVAAWLSDPFVAPHGGESLAAFIARVGSWLDTRPLDAEGSIVAVAEPAVVRAALCHALTAAPGTYWHLDVRPLAAVTLTGRAGQWSLSVA